MVGLFTWAPYTTTVCHRQQGMDETGPPQTKPQIYSGQAAVPGLHRLATQGKDDGCEARGGNRGPGGEQLRMELLREESSIHTPKWLVMWLINCGTPQFLEGRYILPCVNSVRSPNPTVVHHNCNQISDISHYHYSSASSERLDKSVKKIKKPHPRHPNLRG